MASERNLEDEFITEEEDVSTDWSRVEEARKKEGLREGFAAGHEASLQKGFNEGFHQSVDLFSSLGVFHGLLSCIVCHHDVHSVVPGLKESDISTTQVLLQQIEELKSAFKDEIRTEQGLMRVSGSSDDADHSTLQSSEKRTWPQELTNKIDGFLTNCQQIFKKMNLNDTDAHNITAHMESMLKRNSNHRLEVLSLSSCESKFQYPIQSAGDE